MGWMDKVYSTYQEVKHIAIDSVVDVFQVAGSMACITGGLSMAVSFAMDESLRVSYYGSVLASGEVVINAGIKGLAYNINDTIPFSQYQQVQGQFNYNLKDFVDPLTIRLFSGVLVGAGSVLGIFGANLKFFHTCQIEAERYQIRGMDIGRPSATEYKNKNLESLSRSLFWAFFGYMLLANGINYSGWLDTSERVTYPTEGLKENISDYDGPLSTYIIPFEFSFNKTVAFDVFGFQVEAQVDEVINADANATYGGEVLLKSNNHATLDVATAAVLSTGAYLAHRFFSKKVTQQRDDRLIDAMNVGNARKLGYYMI